MLFQKYQKLFFLNFVERRICEKSESPKKSNSVQTSDLCVLFYESALRKSVSELKRVLFGVIEEWVGLKK